MVAQGLLKSAIAHREVCDGVEKRQLLKDHLMETAVYAAEMGSAIGIGQTCCLLGAVHDICKGLPTFQDYIRGRISSGGDHSAGGGYCIQYIWQTFIESTVSDKEKKLYLKYNNLLMYPLLAHHGLFDCIKNNEYKIDERVKRIKDALKSDGDWEELFSALNTLVSERTGNSLQEIYVQGYDEFCQWHKKIKELVDATVVNQVNNEKTNKKTAYQFYCGAMVRLLLSILKEADVYDSSNYFKKEKQHRYKSDEITMIWQNMGGKVEDLYASYGRQSSSSELNRIRTALADEVYQAAERAAAGCFSLDMPVGSGKTMAVLRYSLRHAALFANKRIFYTTAFLSVLEQNASEIKKIIGDTHVLEHPSNVISDDEIQEGLGDEEYSEKNYLRDSWESPFILTTLVQLSNTLFKGKAASIRRFSKLIRSVLIIDEIQSLPIKTMYLYNLMTNFLTHIMGVTVIHCTATLPSYSDRNILAYPCLYHQSMFLTDSALVKHPVFTRVQFFSLLGPDFEDTVTTSELVEHVKQTLLTEKSVLIIANLKRSVKKIYEALLADGIVSGEDCIYLTTNLCAAHRLEKIEQLKVELKRIRSGKRIKPLICVSTNLISAGVNVDFDCVYRAITSVDGLIQAAGRCNREGKRHEKGKVYLWAYAEERLDTIDMFRMERNATKSALQTVYGQDPLPREKEVEIPLLLSRYYRNLYVMAKEKNELAYPVVMARNIETSLLNWLSTNSRAANEFKRVHGKTAGFLQQNFKRGADEFNLIDQREYTVIVQHENDELIDELYEAIEKREHQNIMRLVKRLQRYTVTIQNIQTYEPCVQVYDDMGICILDKNGYDRNIGLTVQEMEELIF